MRSRRSSSSSLHGRRVGLSGGRGRQLGIEGVSRDGCALEDETRGLRQQSELLSERGGDRGRNVDARDEGSPAAAAVWVGRPTRELLEVERIAAAVLVEVGRVCSVADELAGVLEAQCARARCA